MLNTEITYRTTAPHMQMPGTMWRCERCNLLVSIHCERIVQQAFCPVCGDMPLEFCGTVANVLGPQFADA
jgi:rubrerythrin